MRPEEIIERLRMENYRLKDELYAQKDKYYDLKEQVYALKDELEGLKHSGSARSYENIESQKFSIPVDNGSRRFIDPDDIIPGYEKTQPLSNDYAGCRANANSEAYNDMCKRSYDSGRAAYTNLENVVSSRVSEEALEDDDDWLPPTK